MKGLLSFLIREGVDERVRRTYIIIPVGLYLSLT